MSALTKIRRAAMGLLARREHSQFELQRKLRGKFFEHELIDQVLRELTTSGLLSNERFTEAYIQMRIRRGYGPVRISAELAERGVAEDLIAAQLELVESVWDEQARMVRHKRFGAAKPRDFAEQARQMRFLQYRGFTTEQIKACLKAN